MLVQAADCSASQWKPSERQSTQTIAARPNFTVTTLKVQLCLRSVNIAAFHDDYSLLLVDWLYGVLRTSDLKNFGGRRPPLQKKSIKTTGYAVRTLESKEHCRPGELLCRRRLFRQAAETSRLAACAPQISRSMPRRFFRLVRCIRVHKVKEVRLR